MKKCPDCAHEFEGSPRFCNNCGRVNSVDKVLNVAEVRSSIKSGSATKEDYDFLESIQKEINGYVYRPPDRRTTIGKFLGWPTAFISFFMIFRGIKFDITFIVGLGLTLLGAAWYTFGPRRTSEFYLLIFYILGLTLILTSLFY